VVPEWYDCVLSPSTIAEFKSALLTRPVDEVLQDYVFSGDPYAFRDQPNALLKLRSHVSSTLKVDEKNIVVVGSAQIGFSLSPDNFPRWFTDQSDIDVVVVDERLFDIVWHTLLQWHYPRRQRLPRGDWAWASSRRKELYWGWFVPNEIRFDGLSLPSALKPIRDCSTLWFNTFQSLTDYPEFSKREVNGRLYRTWQHVRLYHAEGLRQIREILRAQKAPQL
jgi:hypothetical protein